VKDLNLRVTVPRAAQNSTTIATKPMMNVVTPWRNVKSVKTRSPNSPEFTATVQGQKSWQLGHYRRKATIPQRSWQLETPTKPRRVPLLPRVPLLALPSSALVPPLPPTSG
jgi:hypothetical protein